MGVLKFESQAKHVGDDYFLTSGDLIRYFFEPAAFGKDGKLNRPKEKSVNKVRNSSLFLHPFRRQADVDSKGCRSDWTWTSIER